MDLYVYRYSITMLDPHRNPYYKRKHQRPRLYRSRNIRVSLENRLHRISHAYVVLYLCMQSVTILGKADVGRAGDKTLLYVVIVC
jgi:hypothetical protein